MSALSDASASVAGQRVEDRSGGIVPFEPSMPTATLEAGLTCGSGAVPKRGRMSDCWL